MARAAPRRRYARCAGRCRLAHSSPLSFVLQLFALQTEAAASSTPPFPLLPPGPLHGGACAALLTLCAARRTPARAYLQVAGVEGAVGSAVAAAFAAALSAEAALAGLEGADAPDGAAAADAAAAAGALKAGRPVSTVYA